MDLYIVRVAGEGAGPYSAFITARDLVHLRKQLDEHYYGSSPLHWEVFDKPFMLNAFLVYKEQHSSWSDIIRLEPDSIGTHQLDFEKHVVKHAHPSLAAQLEAIEQASLRLVRRQEATEQAARAKAIDAYVRSFRSDAESSDADEVDGEDDDYEGDDAS